MLPELWLGNPEAIWIQRIYFVFKSPADVKLSLGVWTRPPSLHPNFSSVSVIWDWKLLLNTFLFRALRRHAKYILRTQSCVISSVSVTSQGLKTAGPMTSTLDKKEGPRRGKSKENSASWGHVEPGVEEAEAWECGDQRPGK